MSVSDLIVHADEIEGFALPGDECVYSSQCLVDSDGVGSQALAVNRFTLHAGQKLAGAAHPADSDECYYVLRGRGRLYLGGDEVGNGSEAFEVGPDTAIFIPGGTYHRLENDCDEEIVLLTIWPRLPTPGANHIYDERKRAWGTAFRKKAR